MSKRTSEALTFSLQLSTIVDSHLIKEGVFSPFCGSEYTKKTECVCVVYSHACLVFEHIAGALCSQGVCGGVCVCVCWGWGGAPECHLFSVMWPSSDTVNHRTGGT